MTALVALLMAVGVILLNLAAVAVVVAVVVLVLRAFGVIA